MDDIRAIRLRNFRALFAGFREQPGENGLPDHGSQTRFAEFLKMSVTRVNHLLTETKNVGEDAARDIEHRLNLPHGWMDNNHAPGVLAPSAKRRALQEFADLYDRDKDGAALALQRYKAIAQQRDKAKLPRK